MSIEQLFIIVTIYSRDMQQQSIQRSFYKYLEGIQNNDQKQNKEISSLRLMEALQLGIQGELVGSSIFKHEYFRQNLKEVSSTIINIAFKQNPPYIAIKHIVAYFSIFQYILHSQKLQLPAPIHSKLSRYINSLILLQEIERIRQIYEFSLNSDIINQFYHSVYIKAYEFTFYKMMRAFGVMIKREIELPIILLKVLVQTKSSGLQVYESQVTSEWIILSLVYFFIYYQCEENNQIPIFSAILHKHTKQIHHSQCSKPINGDHLHQFYNNFILEQLGKIQIASIEKIMSQVVFDEKIISSLIVSPICNDNNTVLDNLIFTSSLEPSLQP